MELLMPHSSAHKACYFVVVASNALILTISKNIAIFVLLEFICALISSM